MEIQQTDINQLEEVVKEFITETVSFLNEWMIPAFLIILLGIILFTTIFIFKNRFN